MSDHRDLMRQAVLVAKYIGPDQYGDGVYATPVELPARIEYMNRRALGLDNKELVSTVTIIVDTAVEITARDRFTLPDGKVPTIVAIEREHDDHGKLYYQAALAQ